jgi:hypothetical protein
VTARPGARLGAVLLVLASCFPGHEAEAARVERSQASITLPPGRSVLSPYVHPESGAMVLHVQPVQQTASERLVDARTGQPWSGELSALLKDYNHLGSEALADVVAGSASDLALLRALGCGRGHIACTSAQDADVLLLIAPAGRDGATLSVVDLRPVLAEMEDLLAGRRDGAAVDWGDLEWQVLAVAAQRPERRARWLDALRSIRTIDAFQRVLASVTTAPRLASRPLFQGARAALDLRSELELLGHRLLVGAHVGNLLGGAGAPALTALADALESATQPPNQIGVATHLVDLLADRPVEQRQRLASDIGAEATRRKSEVLHCFALWVDGRPCGQGAPPWVVAQAPAAATPPPVSPRAPDNPPTRVQRSLRLAPSRPVTPRTNGR